MSHIFISHVEKDADIALGIALGLEQAGFRTWCYETDSVAGKSYLLQTKEAIERSSAVVLVISAHSLSSSQITKEVVRAHESGKHFVPVLRGITHVEFQARQPEWREAIGAATSIGIPSQGVAEILPRVALGLRALGIHGKKRADAARVDAIRRRLPEPTARSSWPPTAPGRTGTLGPATAARQVGHLRHVLAYVARHPLRHALVGVGIGVLVFVGIAVVAASLSGGGEDEASPAAVVASTPITPASSATAAATRAAAATEPSVSLTIPGISPAAWGDSVERNGISYALADASWEDAVIKEWLSNPLQDGDSSGWISDAPGRYKVFYPIGGASTAAPLGARVFVEIQVQGLTPGGLPVSVWVPQGMYELQDDGTWKGQTSFPEGAVDISLDLPVGLWISLVTDNEGAVLTGGGYLAGRAIIMKSSASGGTP